MSREIMGAREQKGLLGEWGTYWAFLYFGVPKNIAYNAAKKPMKSMPSALFIGFL